jgi:hypothetical protein
VVTVIEKGKFFALCLFICFSCPLFLCGQTSTKVVFYNKGKMFVSPNPGISSLYIKNAIHVKGNTEITQQGVTIIGGDFYHDALSTVFKKEGETFPSKGRIVFAGNNDIRRLITTKDNPIDDFDRGNYFIAFPEIEIETSDTVVIPSRMGIDALKIIQTSSQSGKILLESNSINSSSEDPLIWKTYTYDASLRLRGTGEAGDPENSSDLVPPGAVVVERDLTPYRVADGETGAGLLFAFASPFKDQRSGYFAGNWIRRMIETNDGHVQFVYGNRRDPGTNIIIPEQYIINPAETFVSGKGYLIKLRATGFNYQDLINTGGLPITAADPSDYDLSKFIFNGKPYQMEHADEQLFADDILFQRTVNLTTFPRDTTINWIIGNSYTAPISIPALIELMGPSPLNFEPNLYVFPHGSTTYQIYKLQSNANAMQVIEIDEIPAMSYFMIRLDRTRSQYGTFTLHRNDLLTHGTVSHNLLRSARMPYDNEIVIRISPESNPSIYDLSGIGLRQNGNPNTDNNDIIKSEGSSELFSIYTEGLDRRKLSANILPETTESVPLFVLSGSTEGQFLLDVSRMESLRTEGLWLEDLIERKTIDLVQTNGRYTFRATPHDPPGRFIIHFKRLITGIDTKTDSFLQVYYSNGQLKIKGLDLNDRGSTIRIFNMQGQILQSQKIVQTPETTIDIPLTDGIYIAKLEGKRSIAKKFKN